MRLTFPYRIIIALIFLSFHAGSRGQVCSGSLGDAVVNVDFGNGSNPGTPLSSAVTTYNFTSSSCPDDGSYTVVSSTAGCFGGTWHGLPEDHTANDVNGYMMLVNASFTPGDFYLDTVRNLCASTTYEFAAWITNVLLPTACSPNPIFPKLVFNIETITGTVLGTYSTGDIPGTSNPTWTQYGLFFKTPANTNSVVIRLTNTAPGGCGNDLALDDITFRPCGPTVNLAGSNNQSSFDFCKGNTTSVNLSVTIGSGYTNPSVQWQQSLDSGSTWTDIAGANGFAYTANHTAVGIYQYRLMVADGSNITLPSCRIASNAVTIKIHDTPIATASNNGPVCEQAAINLMATGGATYSWSGPGGFASAIANPSFVTQTNSSGQYNVTVKDQFGCSSVASTMVVTNPQPIATVSSNKNICDGDSTMLTAGGGNAYTWSPAAGLSATAGNTVIAKPTSSTSYSVVVSNNRNCTDTATVTVTINTKPVANAGPDKVILKGQSVMLDGVSNGGATNQFWSPAAFLDNPLSLTPVSNTPIDQLYTLQVTSTLGCGSSTDQVMVKVYTDLYVPKAFTPNNDGLNDTWRIGALAVFPGASVLVYNRYGQLVFESTSANKDWNGFFKNTVMPAGAYTYLIDLKNNRPVIKGTVLIIR